MDRNNSSLLNGFFDDSKYIEVAAGDVKKLFDDQSFNLPEIFDTSSPVKLIKIGSVKIQNSFEGELLMTRDEDNTFITYNTAKAGDFKITNLNNGSQYFLTMKKVQDYYDTSKISDGKLLKHVLAGHLRLKKHIKILASWNNYQYLQPGDYVIKKLDDVYGIKKSDFVKCYQIIN